jgi:hypothetical protein
MDKQVMHSFNTTLTVPINTNEKQNLYLLNPSNKDRRKSIIPPNYLPKNYDLPPDMMNEEDSSPNDEPLLIDIAYPKQSNNKVISSIPSNENLDNDISSMNKPDIYINKDGTKEAFNFDSFILENFTRYSGDQDVNVWLDETVKKFNRLFICNNSRYLAIPLLVEGIANKVYIKNQRTIQSFTDFQELLLLHFDNDDSMPTVHHPQPRIIQHTRQLIQDKSSDDKNSNTMMTLDNSHFSENHQNIIQLHYMIIKRLPLVMIHLIHTPP